MNLRAADTAALSARELILALHGLRGAAAEPDYAERVTAALMRLCRGQQAWWLVEPADGGWTVRAEAGDGEAADAPLQADWRTELTTLALRARSQGFASAPLRSSNGAALWAVAIQPERAPQDLWLLHLPDRERPQLNELVLRAQLVADLPAPGTAKTTASTALVVPDEGWAPLLDVALLAVQHERFEPAALALVNALAAALNAQQVALGWRPGSDGAQALHAVALSHRDKFDRFAHPVVLTEGALDEALDVVDGVFVPVPGADEDTLALPLPAHRLLQQSLGAVSLASLPLRRGHALPRAALLLVFDDNGPGAAALARLRLTMRLVLPWLETLHERERPFALRLMDAARNRLQGLLGPQRLAWKAGSLALGLLVLYALIGHWDYRVGANGQLATDSTRIISAQFDGRVDDAKVSAGQIVKEGELLAVLDVRELTHQVNDAQAELQRYTAEADKARAVGALAELEVGTARAAQAQARLTRTLEMIEQAANRAPFDGVVVEGDRQELQGAPVRKGDKLYRLARVEKMYATLQVPERDAALLKAGAPGELVLMSRPEEKIPLRVLAVIPVAQTKGQEGNHFMVRAELTGKPADWWRPGMSGTARIDAGERQVAWILTHRLIDQLRLWLWW
ncbi:MAG: efflux RND transporter periplasmic adaptor subunit [Burkholderiaceae bacterium]|nr:efflux RND transporter periplasmic adaptor subunit [Burkholderiaceae bacterium]